MEELIALWKVVPMSVLPDGNYPAIRGGYTVKFEFDGNKYEGKTEKGVRGINIPCVLVVKSGKASVEHA